MASPAADPDRTVAAIRQRAVALGLDRVRDSRAQPCRPRPASATARRWPRRTTAPWAGSRPSPCGAGRPSFWPQARTAIVCGLNYGPGGILPELERRDRGYVSVYARHRDYHDVLKGRLKELAGWLAARFGGAVKVFVDTAPVLEKPRHSRRAWAGRASTPTS